MRLKRAGSGSLAGRSQFSSQFRKPEPIQEKIKQIPAILVTRQTGGIGDILMLTPTIRAIKKENPNIPLIFCTSEKYGSRGVLFDVLKHNPYVDKVINADELINYSFQKIYNFGTGEEMAIEIGRKHHSGNRIDIFADLAKVELTDKSLVYVITGSEKEWAHEWVKKNIEPSRKFLVGIQVHSSTFKRNWPIEKVRLLTFSILNSWWDSSILLFYEGLVSIENNYVIPNVHSIVGVPIRNVAALINECKVMVVPDSGLLHLASALRKKVLGLFGSIPAEARISYYPEASGIYLNWPCSPCWYERCNAQHQCMENITVDMVLGKLSKIVNRPITKKFTGSVLVLREGGVGDLIMLSPSLRSLKKENPEINLILATKPEHMDILKGLPYIDKVISISDTEKERVDHIIDLRYRVESPEVGGSLNTKLYQTVNRIDMFSELVEITLDSKKTDVSVNKSKVSEVKKLLKYNGKYKYLGIQATCTSNLRTIPPEYVIELVSRFSKTRNIRIVLFGRTEFWHGRRSEVDLKGIRGRKIINLMDKLDTPGLIALCSLMDFIIAPDSSAVHIAGSLEKKCLALFGNIPPLLRVKYYPTVKTIYPEGEEECIPCYDFANPCKHYKHLHTEEQPVGAKCMRLLTPDRIFTEALDIFDLKEEKDGNKRMRSM